MRDQMIQAAGGIAMLAAIAHGVLGETRIFARARIEPDRIRLMLRLVWQCGAVAWAGLGILLIIAPFLASDAARTAIVSVAVATYGFGAAANAWATSARHFGWMVLTAASALALAGR